MNYSPVLLESYINQLTDGGRKFFSKVATEAFEVELYDGLHIVHPEEEIDFLFQYDQLTRCWLISADGKQPSNALKFCSDYKSWAFEKSFEYVRGLFFPPAVGKSIGWPSVIIVVSQKPRTFQEALEYHVRDVPKETFRKIREQQKKDYQLYQESLQSANEQYETTPEEVLLFYFRPGKKEDGLFWRASDVVNFMKNQHPEFWKLTEEETGRLLNSEGFTICKGRQNGVRGYFLKYREGFNSGISMELKRAS